MNNITPIPLAAEPVSFAYWVPNVSGGLVVSKIPQRTDWSLEYNVKLAQIAEEVGFDYALSQIRFIGSYGAEYQHEFDNVLRRTAGSHQAVEGDCGDPSGTVASGGGGQAGCDHRSTVWRTLGGERGQWLVCRRV